VSQTAKLTLPVGGVEKTIEFPIVIGSENERAIDIGKLRAEDGLRHARPGVHEHGVSKSAITFLDGEQGILRYRGIPIEQLAEQSTRSSRSRTC
jgi:citrate synthase